MILLKTNDMNFKTLLQLFKEAWIPTHRYMCTDASKIDDIIQNGISVEKEGIGGYLLFFDDVTSAVRSCQLRFMKDLETKKEAYVPLVLKVKKEDVRNEEKRGNHYITKEPITPENIEIFWKKSKEGGGWNNVKKVENIIENDMICKYDPEQDCYADWFGACYGRRIEDAGMIFRMIFHGITE